MTVRRLSTAAVLVALLLFVVSCGLFGGDDPTATPVAERAEATVAVEPSATTAPAAQAAATTAPEAEPTATTAAAEPTAAAVVEAGEETEEPADLPSLAALESVDTYEASMTLRMTKSEDETVITAMDMTVKVDRTNSAQHMSMTSAEEDQEAMSIEVVTIGEDTWVSFGDGWMHTKSDEESVAAGVDDFLMVGDNALDSIEDPELVKRGEEVNGMMTDHYRFTQPELNGMEFMFIDEATGEVWISQEGEYVVRMTMEGTGTMPGEEEGSEVPTAMTMLWEILSVNQPVSIEPPAGFSAADALPVMEGALSSSNYFSTADMAMYEVVATAEEVIQWYKDTLTADGWNLDSEDEMEGMSSASFIKDDTTIGVMVLPSETEDAVSVMVTKS